MHNPLKKIWVPRCLGRLLYFVLYATKELEEGSLGAWMEKEGRFNGVGKRDAK